MTTPPSPPKASFLSLPYELRLLIYDNVICLDLDFCIERVYPTFTKQSLGERWNKTGGLPIQKLALTCRSVAKEIRSHVRLLLPSQRVVCMDLRWGAPFLYGTYLRRLPCRFRQVSALDLEVRLDLPPALRSMLLRRLVRAKVDSIRGSVRHLLHPAGGILKDASGLRDVFIHLTYAIPKFGMLSDEVTNEMDREIRAQVEGQIVKFVKPELKRRTLHLVWDQD